MPKDLAAQIADLDERLRRLDRLQDYLAIARAVDMGDPKGALAIAFRQKGAQKA